MFRDAHREGVTWYWTRRIEEGRKVEFGIDRCLGRDEPGGRRETRKGKEGATWWYVCRGGGKRLVIDQQPGRIRAGPVVE